MGKLVAKVEAPKWVDKVFKHRDIGDEGKQKVWQSFVDHMVGINFGIHLQADLEVYIDSIEESGELDEILEN